MDQKGRADAQRLERSRQKRRAPTRLLGGACSINCRDPPPDGSQYPGSPFTGGGLPGPWAATIDGNDNVWISNFAAPNGPITELCGVRTENCPPGFKTGDLISPPGGYVGGGLQMQTDVAISPSGDVWVMNNWQEPATRGTVDPLRRSGRNGFLRHGQASTLATDRARETTLVLRELQHVPLIVGHSLNA